MTVWLSITPAVGLACRPANSRPNMRATSCRVWNTDVARASEPPIHALLRHELMRQHVSTTASLGQIADGIGDLTQVRLGFASAPGGLRQDRRELPPSLIDWVGGIAPSLKGFWRPRCPFVHMPPMWTSHYPNLTPCDIRNGHLQNYLQMDCTSWSMLALASP